MADFVASTRHHVITGLPLIFTRDPQAGAVTTDCAVQNVWYPLVPSLLPGELSPQNYDALGNLYPAPDFTFEDIDLDTHIIRPQWPTGPHRMPVTLYLASNQFGGDAAPDPARTYRVGLFDVRNRVLNDDSLAPATGAELLWARQFEDVNADASVDTLTLTMTAWPQRDAALRLYVRNDDAEGAAVTFDLLTDIRQLYVRVPIGA